MSMKAVPTIPVDTTATAPAGPFFPDVPTLDDLRRMAARNDRAVVRGVDWSY